MAELLVELLELLELLELAELEAPESWLGMNMPNICETLFISFSRQSGHRVSDGGKVMSLPASSSVLPHALQRRFVVSDMGTITSRVG